MTWRRRVPKEPESGLAPPEPSKSAPLTKHQQAVADHNQILDHNSRIEANQAGRRISWSLLAGLILLVAGAAAGLGFRAGTVQGRSLQSYDDNAVAARIAQVARTPVPVPTVAATAAPVCANHYLHNVGVTYICSGVGLLVLASDGCQGGATYARNEVNAVAAFTHRATVMTCGTVTYRAAG